MIETQCLSPYKINVADDRDSTTQKFLERKNKVHCMNNSVSNLQLQDSSTTAEQPPSTAKKKPNSKKTPVSSQGYTLAFNLRLISISNGRKRLLLSQFLNVFCCSHQKQGRAFVLYCSCCPVSPAGLSASKEKKGQFEIKIRWPWSLFVEK